jgi:hypothetical protein
LREHNLRALVIDPHGPQVAHREVLGELPPCEPVAAPPIESAVDPAAVHDVRMLY